MSINVNGNSKQIDLQKLMQLRLSGKLGRAGAVKKAPGMSMNESIFNKNAQMVSHQNSIASAVDNNSANTTVSGINTTKSINNLNSVKNEGTQKNSGAAGENQEPEKLDISNVDFDNLTSLSTTELASLQSDLKKLTDGDAPFFLRIPFEQKLEKVNAEVKRRSEETGNKLSEDNLKRQGSIEEQGDDSKKESQNASMDTKAATKNTEQGTQTINKTSSDMKTQADKTKTAEKKLKTDMSKGEKLLAKNEKAIQKSSGKISDLTEKNEQLNVELEEATAKMEAAAQSGEGDIEGLKQQINIKGQALQKNESKMGREAVIIKKTQSSSNKTIRRLTKQSNRFVKTMVVNQKNAVAAQNEQNKTLDIANKADEYAGYAVMAGQTTKYVGQGMIALGSSMITGGQALISAGMVTEKVGITTETVGNYGKLAANVTKTAVYAAEGNITGALMSAGSAVMSGASAVKGTKEMAGGFQSVNKEGAKAAAKASDKAANKASEAASKAQDLKDQAAKLKDTDPAKYDKLTTKAEKLDAKATKLYDKSENVYGKQADNLNAKINNHNKNIFNKASEKAQSKADNITADLTVDKDGNALNLAKDKDGFYDMSQVDKSKLTNQQLAKIRAEDAATAIRNQGATKFAEEAEKKLASKMEKAMQFGSFAMTASSQLGFLNKNQGVAIAPAKGRASVQYSRRRKIA